MKILFINPSRAGQGNIPVNLPILISIALSKKCDVKLFDFTDYDCFNDKSYEKSFFKEAQIPSNVSLLTTDYKEDFHKLIHSFQPDLVAVSCMTVDIDFICDFISPYKNLLMAMFVDYKF